MAQIYAGVERTAAQLTARSGEIKTMAKRIQVLAKSIAAASRDSGAFGRSIVVRAAGRGLDRVVVATDPLAAPKEFGHIVRNEAGGPALGYVRGLHVMAKTYQRLPEVTG